MNAWFPLLRTRMILLSGVVLVVAGLMPVLYFVALFVWQITALFQAGSWVALPATLLFTDHALLQSGKAAPVLGFIPEFPWAWLMSPESLLPAHIAVTWILTRLHVGLVFAIVGIAVIAFGALTALRQMTAIRARKWRDEDRLRRVRDYRRDDSQVAALDGRLEPYIGTGGGRNVDRRVA